MSLTVPLISPGRVTAHDRAQKLLLAHLSPIQRHTYLKHGFFYVVGRNGRIYALDRGSNVITIWFGRPHWCRGYYCAHDLPQPDRLLAQKLALEAGTLRYRFMACYSAGGYLGWGPLAKGRYFRAFIEEQRPWEKIGGLFGNMDMRGG